MADIYTGQVGNNWCPQMRLVVSLAAGNADHDLLNWTAYYVAHGYAAYTNGRARAWSINIDGQTQSGSYNINGQTGTVTLGSGQVRVNKQHAYRNIGVSCSMNIDVTWNGAYIGTATASGSQPIGEKQSYTVSYNANGGSGAPGNQTKWHGENLDLSGTKPTRTGHNFAGWATSASGAVAYQPGSTYTGNGNLTLYAKWTPHTYTVSYNANGGSGAPGNQTKTYGVNLTLSSTEPTRTNYTFLGWGTSASSTTVAYNPGATYTGNVALSLYAIWKLAWKEPRITNLTATRCNSAGTLTEEGTYAKVSFSWATDKTISSIKIVCNGVTVNGSGSGTSGSVSVVVGANALSTEKDYPVNVTVTDQTGGVTISTTVSAMKYIQDFAPNGSVSFGKPANPSSKLFDCRIPANFDSTLKAAGAATLSGTLTVGSTLTANGAATIKGASTFSGVQNVNNHMYMGNNIALCGKTTSGSNVSMLRMNTSNQVELNWTSDGLKGRVMKQIWSGNWSSGSINVPEVPYYNVFAIQNTPVGTESVIAIRTGSYIRGFSSTGVAGPGLWANGISLRVNGTTLTLEALVAVYLSAGNQVSTQTGNGIYKIWGLL